MKNLFYCLILSVFAVALTATIDRSERHIEIRSKRGLEDWFLSTTDVKDKDDKKNKKKKKNKHFSTTTTVKPTAKPTTAGIIKMPDDVREKILKMKTRSELEAYMGITKQMKMSIETNYTNQLPKELVRAAEGQGVFQHNPGSGVSHCGCAPTFTRIFLKHENIPALGIFFPHNCAATYKCGGGCIHDDLLECRPKDTTTITHSVLYFYHPFVGKAPQEKNFQIEYHKSCECKCKPKICHVRQSFKDNICDCRCKPDYTKHKLNCPSPLEYDENTCSCVCRFSLGNCRDGQVWDPKLCKCACPKCPTGMNALANCKCDKIKMSHNG